LSALRTYVSPRGHALLYTGDPVATPVLTAENYTKWYELYVVQPDGSVAEVDIVSVEDASANDPAALWIDHLYHPRLLHRLAQYLQAELDERLLEVAIGRWLLEGPDDGKTATALLFVEPS
jgi:hypothetical protein